MKTTILAATVLATLASSAPMDELSIMERAVSAHCPSYSMPSSHGPSL